MSLIMPNGSRTVPLDGLYGGAPKNNVNLSQPQNPYSFTPQQTGAQYNYTKAQAAHQADPRFAAKKYQRAGMSSSKGTQYLGSADAANAYAQGMAGAEAGNMQDAYANANLQLADQVERDRYSNALIGLQEQRDQNQWNDQFSSMNNAMGFAGNMFGQMGKGMGGGMMDGMFQMNPMGGMIGNVMGGGNNLLAGLL